jgi:hypothetical protein
MINFSAKLTKWHKGAREKRPYAIMPLCRYAFFTTFAKLNITGHGINTTEKSITPYSERTGRHLS